MRNYLLIILAVFGIYNGGFAQCTLSATSSGYNAGNTQVYVLVNQDGNIVAQNGSGTFNSVAEGVYTIHALNYDPSNAPAPLPSDLIGMPLSDVGSTTAGCYNSDLLTDYVTQVCASCQQSLTFCEGETVLVTSSGSTGGNTQLYILVSQSSQLIVATNSTGDFTSDVIAGESYQVYALNYDPSDAPNPLPTVGQGVMNTGTVSSGCYNNDFLYDYVCLTINSPSAGTDTQTACDSYTWIDGNTYTASNNSATFILTNAAGCDSTVTLDLTINNSTTGTDTQVACDSYTWIDGNTYTASNNSATFVLTNAAGCDSTVTLDLTINNSTTGTDTQVACDSYTWIDGNTYTASNNIATFVLTNAAGCDSTVTLDLTINNSTTGTDTQTACDSYTWIDGNTYTASNNSATFVLTNAAGCDSTVTLDLTINNSTTGTDVQTACVSYTWIDGNTYTTSNNTATFLLSTSNGCDSLVTLDLTIDTYAAGTDVQTACGSYTWIDGNTYTTSNNTATYTYVNGSVNGCDSIVTLDLTINNPTTGTDTQTACDSYTWIDGNTYTASNNSATFVLTNAAGCDSTVTLDLTINNSTTGTDTQTACDSYTWIDGNTYTASNNSATFVLTNAAGCDSTVTLDLTINNSNTGTDVQSACNSYTWIDGNTYTTSNNTATFVLTNAAGCDSTVTLDLTISTFASGTDTQTACDSYTWIDGNTYTASNNTATYTYVNGSVNGCDSIVTLDLTINNSTTGTDTQVACDSYTWIDGNTYTSSNNSATFVLTNTNGCDSTVTLNLTINNSTTGVDVQSACNSYTWIDGNTYTASNSSATFVLTSASGCDSTVTLDLTINSASGTGTVDAGLDVTINAGESTILTATGNGDFFWSTSETTASILVTPDFSTEYCVELTDQNGCISDDCIMVYVLEDCGELFIPTAFSPNGDSNNETFGLSMLNYNCVETIKISVYDRWGQRVFFTDIPTERWDGTYNGVELDPAVFAYTLEILLLGSSEPHKESGKVVLIR